MSASGSTTAVSLALRIPALKMLSTKVVIAKAASPNGPGSAIVGVLSAIIFSLSFLTKFLPPI